MGSVWWTGWLVEDTNKATVSQPPLKGFPRSATYYFHLHFIGKTVGIVAERSLKSVVSLKLGMLLLLIKLTFCCGIKEIMDIW